MLAWLRRHPLPIETFFRHSLVLAYAYPEALLRPLLPNGLDLDTFEGLGFLAVALVQAERLRPKGLPAFMGQDFFLAGYRIFCRYTRADGTVLRGLRILRSDTDSRFMASAGNLLTHYRYAHCRVESARSATALEVQVRTPGGEADLSVRARLDDAPLRPPEGSPFPDLAAARRYAGPLPYTFDAEPGSRSLVMVEGLRRHWQPRPVNVAVDHCRFLESGPFADAAPRLANAFLVEEVPYAWKRGILLPLSGEAE